MHRCRTARTSTSCSASREGHCNGCQSEFPFRVLEADNIENRQLLCAHCNEAKGDRTQEYLVARLREPGIAA